jgi:hypothetical protein
VELRDIAVMIVGYGWTCGRYRALCTGQYSARVSTLRGSVLCTGQYSARVSTLHGSVPCTGQYPARVSTLHGSAPWRTGQYFCTGRYSAPVSTASARNTTGERRAQPVNRDISDACSVSRTIREAAGRRQEALPRPVVPATTRQGPGRREAAGRNPPDPARLRSRGRRCA